MHRGQLAGLAGLGAVLNLLQQGALGGRGGLAVGGHVTHGDYRHGSYGLTNFTALP
jgi:hypothetical protein